MSGVNNFITDLLENMRPEQAQALIIRDGSYCMFQKSTGSLKASTYEEKVELDEIREDLAALGLTLKEKETYYFRHDPDEGSKVMTSIYYSVSIDILEGKHTIIFRFIKTHSLIRNILRDNNPVTADEYHDYAY